MKKKNRFLPGARKGPARILTPGIDKTGQIDKTFTVAVAPRDGLLLLFTSKCSAVHNFAHSRMWKQSQNHQFERIRAAASFLLFS